MFHRNHFLLFALLFIIFAPAFFFSGISNYPATADTATNLSGFAWSSNIGWISFNWKNCDKDNDGKLDRLCGGDGTKLFSAEKEYSVKITRDTSGSGWQLSGYAWNGHDFNTKKGMYIYFGPDRTAKATITVASGDSLPNDPSDSSEKSWAYLDGNRLKGWARACSVFSNPNLCSGTLRSDSERGGWDGWIKLSGNIKSPGTGNYGATRIIGTPVTYKGYAWGGGSENVDTNSTSNPNDDKNDHPNFIGWISFDYIIDGSGGFCGDGICAPNEKCDQPGYCPSDCPPCVVPPSGPYCGNGICESTESCLTCAQDCGPCGGPTECPDGTLVNPSGVYQGNPDDCGLLVHDCYPTVSGKRVEKIKKGETVRWYVHAEGSSTGYKAEWKQSNGINFPGSYAYSSNLTYNTIGSASVQVKVTNTAGNITARPEWTTCGPVTVYDPTSGKGSIEIITTKTNSTTDLTPYTPVANFAGAQQTSVSGFLKSNLIAGSACMGNISGWMVESIKKPDGNTIANINDALTLTSPTNTTNLSANGGVTNLNLTLKKRNTYWSVGEYIITLKSTYTNTSCDTVNPKAIVKVRIGSSGGEFIEE